MPTPGTRFTLRSNGTGDRLGFLNPSLSLSLSPVPWSSPDGLPRCRRGAWPKKRLDLYVESSEKEPRDLERERIS